MTEETMNLLEGQIQKQLQELGTFSEDEAKRSKAVADLTKLLERYTEAEIVNEKWYDNQERREIEKQKNQTMVVVEAEKNRVGIGRAAIEIAKVVGPMVVSFITLGIWSKKFDAMLCFEKDGTLKTSASRQVGLPKLKI